VTPHAAPSLAPSRAAAYARTLAEPVLIYDTTLRDGCQGARISLSLQDKLDIARRLDDFGVDWIEGGWPGSNPKDAQFFEALRAEPLSRARASAFGSTRHAGILAEDDSNLALLVEAGTPTVVRGIGASHDFGLLLGVGAHERLPMRDDLHVTA
jgi:2-isopropylmalate synthase